SCIDHQLSTSRHRDIISRQWRFLEAIRALELSERAIGPVCVNQMREPLALTDLDGFGNQSVVRAFVTVLDLRDDLSDNTVLAGIAQHDEADQLAAVISSDEIFSEEI